MNKQYVACSICGDTHYLRDMDAVYRRNSWRYYCHKKDCRDEIAEKIYNWCHTEFVKKHWHEIVDAVLDLPHPQLTCTIGEALERSALMIERIKAQDNLLMAYRVGNSKLVCRAIDRVEATKQATFLPDGRKIEEKTK